jgi:hypothetical protein
MNYVDLQLTDKICDIVKLEVCGERASRLVATRLCNLHSSAIFRNISPGEDLRYIPSETDLAHVDDQDLFCTTPSLVQAVNGSSCGNSAVEPSEEPSVTSI